MKKQSSLVQKINQINYENPNIHKGLGKLVENCDTVRKILDPKKK